MTGAVLCQVCMLSLCPSGFPAMVQRHVDYAELTMNVVFSELALQ